MKKNVILFVILLVFASLLQGSTVAVQVKEVTLFKNGLGYFVCEVTPPDNEASFNITPAAAATHGTFWLSYSDDVKLQSLIARKTEFEEKIQAVNIPELLKANVGKKVWLVFDKDERVKCTIKYFAEDRVRPQPDVYAVGGGSNDHPNYRQNGDLMIIEKDSGEMCLNPSSVKRVEFIGEAAEKTYTEKVKRYQLEVKLASPASGQKLILSQLSKGITWAPSYIVDITDPEKALISAKAEIINEACDLNDVTVQLVTGYPHLQFANIVSPMSLKENLAQFLSSLVRGESARGNVSGPMSNIMYQADRSGVMPEVMPAYGVAATGKTAEDLFFYPIEKIQLAKGEVGYFPLFTESVSYKHIYKWDIPDYLNKEDRYGQRRRGEQSKGTEEEVWHCVRLENTSKIPWTTAPAQTIKDGLIIGQDTLNYTPSEGKSTLRITQAINVKAEQVEMEIDRKREAARFYGSSYDLVTVEGKLAVTNMQFKAAMLEITKNISGEIKTSEPEAAVEKLAKGLKQMNTSLKLTWTIDLEPGEHKELEYTYEVYVRR